MNAPAPLVVQLPPVERPPIVIDAPPRPVVAPGLSGGRGMFKRLIVACDGTWMNSDDGMMHGRIAVPSNVTRLSRAIKAVSQDGIPQIINYQKGVASQGSTLSRFANGITGGGLEDNVLEAYAFLANNYHPGDELFLFGFSRGAFTARSIAGFIGHVGLLTRKGLNSLPAVWQDYQHRYDAGYVSHNPTKPFPNKPSASSPRYARELERRGLSRLDIPIKAIGVWDTVGSLGMPRIGLLQRLGVQDPQSDDMAFYDTKISNCIENAFQALALDEKRTSFAPAVWEKPEGNRTTLRQVWFPGAHANVGGGADDMQLADISLAWMMSQVEPFLDLREEYLFEQEEENERWYRSDGQARRPWSFGEIEKSDTGLYTLGGGTYRTPGLYHAVTPKTGRVTSRPLRSTNEYIHPSVRIRLQLGGPGVGDKGIYNPRALTDNYKLVVEPRGEGVDVFWKLRWRDDGLGGTKILPEAPLWRLERELAKRERRVWELLRDPPLTKGKRGSRRRSRSVGVGRGDGGRFSEEVGGGSVRRRRRSLGGEEGARFSESRVSEARLSDVRASQGRFGESRRSLGPEEGRSRSRRPD